MIRREAKLKQDVTKYLKNIKGLWFYKTSDRYTAGIPDIIGCYRGDFFAIELKDARGKVSPLQTHIIKKIHNACGYATVCYNINQVKDFIQNIISNNFYFYS